MRMACYSEWFAPQLLSFNALVPVWNQKLEIQTRWVADFEILRLAEGIGIDAPELLRRAALSQKRRRRQ